MPPQISSYSLDLDEGTISFMFSEPVNASAVQASSITLLNGPSSAVAVNRPCIPTSVAGWLAAVLACRLLTQKPLILFFFLNV